jgi:3-hydroxyisobutyrate dehydrogenase-like beta-hydroxyacid dehydrogenase
MKIAFIGLGNMGAPMARNLIKAGHALNLFDLNKTVLAELAELGGRSAPRRVTRPRRRAGDHHAAGRRPCAQRLAG